MRIIWLTFGVLSVLAGFVGVFLPVLPTVPFLLLAMFFFGRSSQRAHDWLLTHKTLGPGLRDWQDSGAISRKSKYLSAGSMVVVFAISVLFKMPVYVLIIQIVILLSVSYFIWTRPDA